MGPCQSRNIATTLPSSSDGGSILFEANIHSQPPKNEAILTSRTADQSLLFTASNDCMISILDYISIKGICQLDVALTNTAARVDWLRSLLVSNHRRISEYQHCTASLRWLARRGIRLETLKISKGQLFSCRLDGSSLYCLNVSLLRDVSVHKCNIGDEEVISLAHDCPYLSKIRLHDCKRVTDASIVALAKWCVHLIVIDIGECMNITDDGLTAFAYDCSCIKVDYIDDLECI